MNQAEAFSHLYLKTRETTGLLNYVLLLMAQKNHTNKVSNGLKELNDSIGYIKILLQNRKGATKIDNFIGVFERATINKFCNNSYRREILSLVTKNNIADLLDDLIERCGSFEISIGLIKEAYKTKDHYHLVLEFEDDWLKFCGFIKVLHVTTYLTDTDKKSNKASEQRPLLLTQKTNSQQKK